MIAASAAATQPARSPNRRARRGTPTGTVSEREGSESACVSASPRRRRASTAAAAGSTAAASRPGAEAGDVGERVLGDADRQALVDPVARVDRLRAQQQREARPGGEAQQRRGQADRQARRAAGARRRARGRARSLRRRSRLAPAPRSASRSEIASVLHGRPRRRGRSVGTGAAAGRSSSTRKTTAGAGGDRPERWPTAPRRCARAGARRRAAPGTGRCRASPQALRRAARRPARTPGSPSLRRAW